MAAALQTGDSMPTAVLEFEAVAEKHEGATIQDMGGGAFVVSVPSMPLPDGWNKKSTAIHFVVPAGYPYAQPDCFHADLDLRLADGRQPTNTGQQPIPMIGATLWFSWHLTRWKPGRDNLSTWLSVIANRFASLS